MAENHRGIVDGPGHPSGAGCGLQAGAAPLSFAQARMWFLAQLEPDSPAYYLARVTRWLGPLDVEQLRRSLEEIVRRHEVLRTAFPDVEGTPVQEVLPAGPFALPVVDFSREPASDREANARRWVVEEFRRPFDLAQGPLLRAAVVRLNQEEHLLALFVHHIVIDGWSAGILLREAAQLYTSYISGRPSALPELQAQYRDYSLWQRERLQGPVLERELRYWRDQLAGAPLLLNLPLDRPRPDDYGYEGGQVLFALPEDLTQAVIALSRQERVTPFMTLLATFVVLLSRWSGQTDIVVGTPVAGRTRRVFEGLIGCFVNTLALRTDCSGDPIFRELLIRVREVTLRALDHQELPFEKLVEELQPARSLSYHPVFQVLFNYRNYPVDPPDAGALRIDDVPLELGTAKFDLDLSFSREPGWLRGVLAYKRDLFEPETASDWVDQFLSLVQQIVESPDRPIGAYSALTARSRAVLPDPAPSSPLTSTVKLDREALPLPEQSLGRAEHPYVPPRTPIEMMLADIWADVLGVDRVGVYDDFFSLGGNSLLATQVIARAHAAVQVELPLRSFFETPTLEDLAMTITQRLLESLPAWE